VEAMEPRRETVRGDFILKKEKKKKKMPKIIVARPIERRAKENGPP